MVLKYLLQPFSFVILVTSFIVLIFPISVVALPFKQSTRLHITERAWGLFGKIVIYIVCLCQVYKEDNRDEESKAKNVPTGLYIANHSSFMDIPLILTCFRIPPIMKKEVLYIPIFGICGYACGAMVVDRKSADSRKKVFELAKQRLLTGDRCLQYYPEGTRQRLSDRPKSYKEIKKPLMKLAYEEKIPVYAISIFGTRKILDSNGLVNYRRKIGILLHEKIEPSNFEDCDQFMQACWSQVTTGYEELAAKLT